MDDKGAGFVDALVLYGATVAAWIGGESGRVLVAGGAGGFIRWLGSERRLIRDGAIATVGGGISAAYLWPLVLYLTGLDHAPYNIAMAAFLAGAVGMSGVKIMTAVVETKMRRISGDGG